jgi:pSer/pThr/pTyr-binding forkhead associated (FHA) protein
MPQLILSNATGVPDHIPLNRLRTTIGRSARSDVCIPDAFASRLHAEIRQEGDGYWLQDLGSANGTRYNGVIVKMPVPLSNGGEIQIGETRIVFDDERSKLSMGSTLIRPPSSLADNSRPVRTFCS